MLPDLRLYDASHFYAPNGVLYDHALARFLSIGDFLLRRQLLSAELLLGLSHALSFVARSPYLGLFMLVCSCWFVHAGLFMPTNIRQSGSCNN